MNYDNINSENICETCGMPKGTTGRDCESCADLKAARGADRPAAVMHYNPGATAD